MLLLGSITKSLNYHQIDYRVSIPTLRSTYKLIESGLPHSDITYAIKLSLAPDLDPAKFQLTQG